MALLIALLLLAMTSSQLLTPASSIKTVVPSHHISDGNVFLRSACTDTFVRLSREKTGFEAAGRRCSKRAMFQVRPAILNDTAVYTIGHKKSGLLLSAPHAAHSQQYPLVASLRSARDGQLPCTMFKLTVDDDGFTLMESVRYPGYYVTISKAPSSRPPLVLDYGTQENNGPDGRCFRFIMVAERCNSSMEATRRVGGSTPTVPPVSRTTTNLPSPQSQDEQDTRRLHALLANAHAQLPKPDGRIIVQHEDKTDRSGNGKEVAPPAQGTRRLVKTKETIAGTHPGLHPLYAVGASTTNRAIELLQNHISDILKTAKSLLVVVAST